MARRAEPISFSLAADVDFSDLMLQAVLPPIELETGRPESFRTVFYDTFDWRLYRRGLTLRSAGRKGRTRISCCRLETDELLWEEEGELPRLLHESGNGRLRERLGGIVKMRALLPVVTLSEKSTPGLIRDGEGKIVLRLRLREPRLLTPAGRPGLGLPRRLQLMPVRGYGKRLDRVAALLGGMAGVEPSRHSLLEEALSLSGRRPGDYSSKVEVHIDCEDPARTALPAIFLRLLDTMEANVAGIEGNVDSEFLHDFRVAVRRTRSVLSQVKAVFPARVSERFRREFSWLGLLTGPARDMDVYLLQFPGYLEKLPPSARTNLLPLKAFIEKEREREYRKLIRGLRSVRCRRLFSNWRAFLEKPAVRGGRQPVKAWVPVREIADARIRKNWRLAMKEGGAIHDDSPADDLHELRKTCKKLRYLLEVFQSLCLPAAVSQIVDSLKVMQDNLGEFQDLQVHSGALKEFSRRMEETERVPGETFMAMGMLIEGKQKRQRSVRRKFTGTFGLFAGKKNRALFEKIFAAEKKGARE